MTAEVVVKKTVLDLMVAHGLTCTELAAKAGVHYDVVRRATTPGSLHMTHVTSAKALDVNVEDIHWINGLSTTGRTAHSNSPILHSNRLSRTTTCPVHFTILPASGVCDDCN